MGNCWNCFNKPAQQTESVLTLEEHTALSGSATTLEEITSRHQTPESGSSPTVEKVIESPGQQTPAHTVEEVINSLKHVSDTTDLNKYVDIVKQLLEEVKSGKPSTSTNTKEDKGSTSESAKENRGMWTSLISSGAKFLKFVNDHTEKIEDKEDILYSGNSRVVAEILGQIGQLHWAVGGLAIAAYLMQKFEKVSANKREALELLSIMVDLVTTVIRIRDVMPREEENLKKAVMLLVQGSIMCVSQIHSEKIFSFLKTSVNSENLKEMSNTIDHLYRDLNLTITTAIAERQSEIAERQTEIAQNQTEIAKRQSIRLPVPKPFYPKNAVGIEKAQEEVIDLLHMTPEDEATMAVIIYGFGGIGKTTLATSVVATLNLDRYNYARVKLEEEESKNDFKNMQKLILKDAFPNFYSGAEIKLRDSQEGRDRLKEAFLCQDNKPVFLFIDNGLRSEDLMELLPEDLNGLPKCSRILVTTRKLDSTDFFQKSGLKRCPFTMKTLKPDHAVKILCKDSNSRELIKDDMERILRICGGVPLALTIVRGHLDKMGYNAGKCHQILEALEKGSYVKEEHLSQRLVHFVYNELEDSTKNAFLVMCWFFPAILRRQLEYVVGAQEVKALEDAALVNLVLLGDKFKGLLYLDDDLLFVHDIVRATGLAMATSTRFTDVESFSETAQDEKKLNGIKGLYFVNDELEYVLDVKHLNAMRHSLRVLLLGDKMSTSAQSSMKFKELRFLRVGHDIPHLPVKLDQLDMLRAYLGPIGPNGISLNKLPKRLSNMTAAQTATSEESSFPQGIQNHSLEELCLDGSYIKQLPEELDKLCSLKILTLAHFSELEEFHEQVCKLSSLIKLRIWDWTSLKRLPQSLGLLKGLTHLEIEDCIELEEMPSSFVELTALEHLSFRNCPKLKQLPGRVLERVIYAL